jgi:hypothetical protein
MATDKELENYGRLVRVETLQDAMHKDLVETKEGVRMLNSNLSRLENRLANKSAFQKGAMAAGTVACGGIGAKIASLVGWLS